MDAISADLERVIALTATAGSVSTDDAALVADHTLGVVELLLDEHRRLIVEELMAEADRFTRGGFADGIRHAASAVGNPKPPVTDAGYPGTSTVLAVLQAAPAARAISVPRLTEEST